MRKNLFYFLIILGGFIGGIFIKIYIHKKNENKLFYNELKNYFFEPKNLKISKKIFFITLDVDTPLIFNLIKNENYLILYFRINDCLTCLEELRHVIDTFENSSDFKVLVATDHPILHEIKFFIYKLGLRRVIWDKDNYLLGVRPLKTPFYIFVKKNKIKGTGMITPLKREWIEVYGLYAHKLKEELK